MRLVTAACLGVLLLTAGCGSGASGGGDPGNRRLHELAAEAVFTVTPPGLSQPAHVVETPAHKRPAGFGSGGWEGPRVIASFTSAAKPANVLRAYDAEAIATGWRATAAGAYGVNDRWTKTYADGTPAYLTVTVLPTGSSWSYSIAASAPAA